MVLVKSENYLSIAEYYLKAKTIVDNVEFQKIEKRDSLNKALELARAWKTPNIDLSLSRTIFFERKDGYISEQEESKTNCSYPTNVTNPTNYTNYANVMFVQKRHVERAWQIIKPCLEYANELITYVDMGKPLAKCREYIKKFEGGWVTHSDLLRMTNLSAKEVKEAIDTLVDREEIERVLDQKRKNGRVYGSNRYRWNKVTVEKPKIRVASATVSL